MKPLSKPCLLCTGLSKKGCQFGILPDDKRRSTPEAELRGGPKRGQSSTSPRTPSGSRPGTGRAENLARWSFLALQSTETLTGRCDSDINCNSGPSWQSSIDFKERNLGFRSCKDQVWFVAHCQGVEQEVSLVPLTASRDQDG